MKNLEFLTTTTAQEVARIEWLLTFEQHQERIEALQRELLKLETSEKVA